MPRLVCEECGAVSDEQARGWRVYVAGPTDDGPDEPQEPKAMSYCPDCAAAESDA